MTSLRACVDRPRAISRTNCAARKASKMTSSPTASAKVATEKPKSHRRATYVPQRLDGAVREEFAECDPYSSPGRRSLVHSSSLDGPHREELSELNTVERFDPRTEHWLPIASMLSRRFNTKSQMLYRIINFFLFAWFLRSLSFVGR